MSKVLHGLILIATFVVAVLVVLLIHRPDIVEKWWLWAIGMAAPAIAWFKAIKEKLTEYINDLKKSEDITTPKKN